MTTGDIYRLRKNRGLPYRWRVEAIEGDRVHLRCEGRTKTISVKTLRKDYERVER